MATFTTRFLGCKVSFADEQAIRERLLADGHTEGKGTADVAVINTCCVTNEAVSKSRQAAAQAARSHERVYVTGCAANLAGERIRRPRAATSASSPDAARTLPTRSRATSARSAAFRRSTASTGSVRL